MGAVQESHVGFQYCRDMVCNERDTLGDENKIPVEILVINVDNKCCRDIVNRKKHTYKNEAIERLRIEMQSILDRNFSLLLCEEHTGAHGYKTSEVCC